MNVKSEEIINFANKVCRVFLRAMVCPQPNGFVKNDCRKPSDASVLSDVRGLDGIHRNDVQRGLNIVVTAGGSIKKILSR